MLSLKQSEDKPLSNAEIKHFDNEKINKNNNSTEKQAKADSRQKNNDIIVKKTDLEYEPGIELIHIIAPGDTLLGLAKMYSTTIYKIRKLNDLSRTDIIMPGQKLKIISEQKSTYRVRQGDSLASIIKMFGADEHDTIFMNHLEDGRQIWVGQKLYIPISQQKIDKVLVSLDKKKKNKFERKKEYQRQLIARFARQKMHREHIARINRDKQRKAQKAKREKQARIDKARRAFKYSPQRKFKHKIRVTATAYTSHYSQTDSTPFLAAWSNRIRPGMRIIAVSPDMIRKYGITNGVRVKIAGLPGTYTVRDKMNKKWRHRIDIYMGTNRGRALRWGRRSVVMYY
jgi:LysM repeat protein/3D (Asp-Asp-Asp) domain-containing protein